MLARGRTLEYLPPNEVNPHLDIEKSAGTIMLAGLPITVCAHILLNVFNQHPCRSLHDPVPPPHLRNAGRSSLLGSILCTNKTTKNPSS